MGWYCGTELPIQSDIIPMQVEIGYYVQSTDLPEPDTPVMVRHFLGARRMKKAHLCIGKVFFRKAVWKSVTSLHYQYPVLLLQVGERHA